jgi:hypothetical protein
MKRGVLVSVCVLMMLGIGAGVFLYRPVTFAIGLHHLIVERERQLLYNTDHQALARLMRDYAARRVWSSGQPPKSDMGAFIYFWGEDESLTDSLRLLKPSSGKITADEFELEFGGTFMHFGVRVFRPGLAGSGTKRLADGLWFYAEDEKVPSL